MCIRDRYINYPIVYAVTHAKGVSRCVSECKLGSVSEHIHVVQGKTGVDVHIIKALLVKGSVSWRCV